MGMCVTKKGLLSSAETIEEHGDYEMLLVVERNDYGKLYAQFVKYLPSLAIVIKTYLAFIVVVAGIDKTQYVLSIICAILHLRRGAPQRNMIACVSTISLAKICLTSSAETTEEKGDCDELGHYRPVCGIGTMQYGLFQLCFIAVSGILCS